MLKESDGQRTCGRFEGKTTGAVGLGESILSYEAQSRVLAQFRAAKAPCPLWGRATVPRRCGSDHLQVQQISACLGIFPDPLVRSTARIVHRNGTCSITTSEVMIAHHQQHAPGRHWGVQRATLHSAPGADKHFSHPVCCTITACAQTPMKQTRRLVALRRPSACYFCLSLVLLWAQNVTGASRCRRTCADRRRVLRTLYPWHRSSVAAIAQPVSPASRRAKLCLGPTARQ